MMLHSDKRHDNGLGMDATVTICHRYTPTEKLKFYCQNADIIITATGMCFIKFTKYLNFRKKFTLGTKYLI